MRNRHRRRPHDEQPWPGYAKAALSAVYDDIWKLARAEALEEAAQECEARRDDIATLGDTSWNFGRRTGLGTAAIIARSLAGKETP